MFSVEDRDRARDGILEIARADQLREADEARDLASKVDRWLRQL